MTEDSIIDVTPSKKEKPDRLTKSDTDNAANRDKKSFLRSMTEHIYSLLTEFYLSPGA